MTIAFNNPDLFSMLGERGQAISDMDWDKVHNLERAIIEKKNYQNEKGEFTNFNRFVTPVHVFITF